MFGRGLGGSLLVLAALVSACTSPAPDPVSSGPVRAQSPTPAPSAAPTSSSAPASSAAPTSSSAPAPSARPTSGPRPGSQTTPTPTQRTGPDDPRWQFFVRAKTRYRSSWFDGSQRIMIGYGCTPAPFYSPDPRCDGNGFHHGIDVALPCGTTLRAGVDGRVVDPDRPGRPGPAYGSTAFRIRVEFRGERYDVLIGHATRVFVRPREKVRAGLRIATAGARGSPDGCHLHFEQRRVDGGVSDAVDPARLLALRRT